MSYQAFEKNHKKRLGEKYKPNTIQGGGCQVQYLDIKADGFASECSHKQGGYTESEDAESRKERRSRRQNSYRIMSSFP